MGTEHFDSKAETWDQDPDKIEQARKVAAAILAAVPMTGRERLLEYGAGTGLVSQGLAGRVGAVTLADNSPGMRRVLQEKIALGALPAASRVWDVDLEAQPVPDEHFDLVVSSMVLHHIHDLPRVLAAFRGLVSAGGNLCLVDLDLEDGSFHGEDFDGHHGFDREELAAELRAAGFTTVSIGDCAGVHREGRAYSLFLAIARAGSGEDGSAPASS